MIFALGVRAGVMSAVLAGAIATSCNSSSVAPSQPRAGAPVAGRVLFVGNSLTEANGLPLLFPVGEAWRAAWRRDPAVPLDGPDGFHPTPTATYLAALVIYQHITGLSPVDLPSLTPMPANRALLLQAAAQEANTQFGRR
jgi:hypothetical protein